MAAAVVMSGVHANNKLIQFTTEINREYVRENLFSPYMGTDATSIIRIRNEAKKGGEQINFPLVGALYGPGTAPALGAPTQAYGIDTLTGFEEKIDSYGMRVWIDWARNAVATNDAEEQKDSADVFGEAKPLLSDWGKSLQRDEIILALMNIPSETAPTNLGGLTTLNGRVNGVPFATDITAATLNTWVSDNADRVVFGNAIGNVYASPGVANTFAAAMALVDTTADTFTPASVSLMKYRAKTAVPKIRPYQTQDGREYYVAFAGTANFVQLKTAMNSAYTGTAGVVTGMNMYARSRESEGKFGAPNNPLFQDGDLIYDGVIIREVPEIDNFVTAPWKLHAAGAGTSRTAPVFLCGQQAVMFAWGKMATPTFRDQTDYQFVRGVGVKMCYGVAKTFRIPRATPNGSGTAKVQTGVVTGIFSAATPV